MLMEIGEAIKDYYTASHEPLPSNVLELLRRLDDDAASDDAASENRRSGGDPSSNRK
jgi:hypothetical protein